MASLVSQIVVIFAVVAVSSSDASNCVECSIDHEAEQESTCVITCDSPGKDGPSVILNGEALRTVQDCDRPSIETNQYCLLRKNGISVGAKIKSTSERTLFEYNPNTKLCNDTCEFSVEFNGPTCSVVSEDLSKPCINSDSNGSEPDTTKPPTTTPEPPKADIPSGPPGVSPLDRVTVIAVPLVIAIIIIMSVLIVTIIIRWKCKQGKGGGPNLPSGTQKPTTTDMSSGPTTDPEVPPMVDGLPLRQPYVYSHVSAKDVLGSFVWLELLEVIKDMLTKSRLMTMKRDYNLIDSACNSWITTYLNQGYPYEAATTLIDYFIQNHRGYELLRFCNFLRNEAEKAGGALRLKDLADKIERAVKDAGTSEGKLKAMEPDGGTEKAPLIKKIQ